MRTYKILLWLLLNFSLIFGQKNCGYSWEIYNGHTPEDAIEGGKNAKGETFYVGLVHLKTINETLPGMIIPSSQGALVTSYGIVFYAKNDLTTEIKILCSGDKDGFKWILTTSSNVESLTNRNLVPGGVVLGQHLYIGRVRYNGGVVLGKVFPHNFIFRGLYVPASGTHVQFLAFEILGYKCKKGENKKTEAKIEVEIDKKINEIFGST